MIKSTMIPNVGVYKGKCVIDGLTDRIDIIQTLVAQKIRNITECKRQPQVMHIQGDIGFPEFVIAICKSKINTVVFTTSFVSPPKQSNLNM
jgi:hypothetical protein